MGQESLRGQAEDHCVGILVLFAEQLEARPGGSWPVTDLMDAGKMHYTSRPAWCPPADTTGLSVAEEQGLVRP